MQAAALSFMDVDKLAGDTMAVCERMPLSDDDRATLRTAYRTFRDVHLPQQATVRQFVEQSFTTAGPKGEQMLRQMQEPAVQQQLAFYFATEKSSSPMNDKSLRGAMLALLLLGCMGHAQAGWETDTDITSTPLHEGVPLQSQFRYHLINLHPAGRMRDIRLKGADWWVGPVTIEAAQADPRWPFRPGPATRFPGYLEFTPKAGAQR